jgi:5-formyltetrahydrofolate cyclo-ligase
MAPTDPSGSDPAARDSAAAAADAELRERKKRLRRDAQVQRRRAAEAAGVAAGRLLCAQLLDNVAVPAETAVSGYWPMGEEIDPVPALEALHARGHPIGLPVMPGKQQPLRFRRWQPHAPLVEGGFGTMVPAADAEDLAPRLLLVPLLAFDRQGYRLGYGGGFYDRTLAELRAQDPHTLAVGVAYAGQEIDAVPHDANDQRLDAIVTEQGPVPLDPAGAP